MKNMPSFAKLLAMHLAASGVKQTYLATTAHISYNYLQRLLAGGRHPSDQVVYNLAQALRLTPEQTGALLIAAGHTPSAAFLQAMLEEPEPRHAFSDASTAPQPLTHMIQRLYRLAQRIPEPEIDAFVEEMHYLMNYAHFKYVICGGANLLEHSPLDKPTPILDHHKHSGTLPEQASLSLIAQVVGELHGKQDTALAFAEGFSPSIQTMEQVLTAIDQFIGTLFAGEAVASYRPDIARQMLDMLQMGAPWEIRRRIAEGLPDLCRLDVEGTLHLLSILRDDHDDQRGVDIRRRVLEALPKVVEVAPETLPDAIALLHSHPGDDQYVLLTSAEVCYTLQTLLTLLKTKHHVALPDISTRLSAAALAQCSAELARFHRHLVELARDATQESLRYAQALYDLLREPETALLSIREGVRSPEKLIQWVAVRSLEQVLPVLPHETLALYQVALRTTAYRNVRRTVAKAFPVLVRCLNEAELSVRTLARAIMIDLATDPDVYIRRAVADHAMHLFAIDREFLLTILRLLSKERDQAIRSRLQPVALRLAQVWLIWYAETAGLVDPMPSQQTVRPPFGE
jgi:transcriptional regulator with XRE-family HTH domain